MSIVYNRLKKICDSGSSIGISAQSWKELERLWTLLENLVNIFNLFIMICVNILSYNNYNITFVDEKLAMAIRCLFT